MFFVVQDWMISELGLKGNELLVYAVIYGYSQEGQGCYYGGMSFLAESLGITRQTAITSCKNLAERGLIRRNEESRGGVHFCSYEAQRYPNDEILTGCKDFLQGVSKNLTEGCKNFLHNNIRDSIKDNINNPQTPLYKLPYDSEEFRSTWAVLIKQPKWRGKSKDALAKSAELLGEYPQDIAIKMMNASIRNGWQGLFPLKINDMQPQGAKTSSAQSRAREAREAAEAELAATLAAEQQALIEGGVGI